MEPQCQTPLGTVRTESRRHNPYAPATPVQGAPHSSSTQQATRARTLASPLSVMPHAHPTTQARSLADSGAPLPAPPPAMVLTVGKGDIQKTFLVTNDAQVLAPSATGGASHTQLTKEVVARPALSLAPHAVTPPRVLFKDESPAARSHGGTDSATTPSHSLTQHPIEVKKSSHGGHSGTVGSDESSDDDYDVALEGPKDEDHLRRAQLFLLAAPRLALSFPDDLLDPAHTLKPGRTVAARQKQIQHGYSRPEYQRYLEQVPKANRQPGNKNHPFTPRANYKSARRRFKALCRAWRVCLHVWGLPEMDAHKAAMHSESPGPQPADQDSPQANEELHVLDPNLDPEILSTPKSNRHAEVSGADDGSRTTPVSQLCIPQSFGSKLPTPNTAVPLHRPTPLKPKLSPRSESPSSSPPERLFGSRSHE